MSKFPDSPSNHLGAYYLLDIPIPSVNAINIDEYVSLDRALEAVQWEHIQKLAHQQYDRVAVAGTAGWSHANEFWFNAYDAAVALAKENLGI